MLTTASDGIEDAQAPSGLGAMWVERLTLTGFRNYAQVQIRAGAAPVVLYGANGAGKTNLLEALSLLSPGRGLRRAAFPDLTCHRHEGVWAVAARLRVGEEVIDIGTGLQPDSGRGERTGRIVRINGTSQSGSGALGFVQMVWLTPASDGLFTGAAGERRRFLDRLTAAFDPGHALRAGQFERAMRQRNRLLDDGVTAAARYDGLELIMAETGVAMAAARVELITALNAEMATRRERDPDSAFPWAALELEGSVETSIAAMPAVDAEDAYREQLAGTRARDRAAGRTLEGPHRADLLVRHGPKDTPARLCSTGEQKALLVGLTLAHAEQLARRRDGAAPIMLLDEIAAHLDVHRRQALYRDIVRLGAQAWLTGTDREAFEGLSADTRFLRVEDGHVTET